MKLNSKKRVLWTDEATIKLIDCWRQVIPELQKAKRNRHIYEYISVSLKRQGIAIDAEEVHVKINNLTQRYRKEKTALGYSNDSQCLWKFYKAIDKIFGHLKNNHFSMRKESVDIFDIETSACMAVLPSSTLPITSLETMKNHTNQATMLALDQESHERSKSTLNEENIDNEYEKNGDYLVIMEEEKFRKKQNPQISTISKNMKRRKRSYTNKIMENVLALTAGQLDKEDDEFTIMAKGYTHKLKKMKPLQRLYADRVINEILLEGQLETLNRYSSLSTTSTFPSTFSEARHQATPSIIHRVNN